MNKTRFVLVQHWFWFTSVYSSYPARFYVSFSQTVKDTTQISRLKTSVPVIKEDYSACEYICLLWLWKTSAKSNKNNPGYIIRVIFF